MKLNNEMISGQESKYEQAYKAIKQSIINHELAPHTLLVERRLSEALNISRTPIRQVLQQLVNEGFVEYVVNKGMFVTEFNVLDAIEIYTIREALDPVMLEGCYKNNYQIVLNGLDEALLNQDKALSCGDIKEYVKNDLAFHNVIIYNCANKRLENFMGSMLEQIKRGAYWWQDREREQLSVGEHRRVFEAYKTHNITEAKLLIAAHMRSVKNYYLTKMGLFEKNNEV